MNAADAETEFSAILDGAVPDAAIKALLIDMATRGETAEDLVGAAKAMRARMVRVKAPATAIDVCGTGGDGQHSLNISTAVAIVVAACGVPVAKHGSRAATSRAGAADTLQALGLNLDNASLRAEASLNDMGIAFLFAQKHHPALARLASIRKEIGSRTIFNLLGPLCNPADVTRQLIGVSNAGLIAVYADALRQLGTSRAMIVSGAEGLDEISISGPTHVTTIGMKHMISGPHEMAGLPPHPLSAFKGGDAAYNAAELYKLMAGTPDQNCAYRDAVLINAAGALIVAEEVDSWERGVEEAREAIDKGLAKALLDCWIKFCA